MNKHFLHSQYLKSQRISSYQKTSFYQGYDMTNQKMIIISQTPLTGDTQLKNFQRGLSNIKKWYNPYLPIVLDSFKEDDELYVIYEYVKGITLEEYIRQYGPLNHLDTCKYINDLGNALSYLHNCEKGFSIGCLSAENIIIDSNNFARILFYFDVSSLVSGNKIQMQNDIHSLGLVANYLVSGCYTPFESHLLPKYFSKAINSCLNPASHTHPKTVDAFLSSLTPPFSHRFAGKFAFMTALAVAILAGVIATGTYFKASAHTNNNVTYQVTDQAGNHITLGRLSMP